MSDKLSFGVGKGMLAVKHFAPKILLAVNYCGCCLGGMSWLAKLSLGINQIAAGLG